MFENIVFKEILFSLPISQKIRFWRTKQGAEIDFLILKGEDIIPIEVKSNIKKSDIPLGLKNFIEKYAPQKGFVVNLSLKQKIKINETKVEFIPPFEIKNLIK